MNQIVVISLLLFLILFLSACQCIIDDPVCGADQKTYTNKCVAAIVRIDSVRGECTVPTSCESCGCSAQILK